MYIYYNPNPLGKSVGDCVVRALCRLLGLDWLDVYMTLCLYGAYDCDMPSSNKVWSTYLKEIGYKKFVLPETCPNCYTVKDFCRDHKQGSYLLSVGDHVVTAIDGNYYDAWDSGNEVIIGVFTKVNIFE